MSRYASQAALVLRMMKARGKHTAFTRGGAVIDPVTQHVSAAPTEYEAYVVAQPLSAGKARYLFGEGADISKSRLSISMALSGVSATPKIGDRFTWGGATYALLSIEPLSPADEGAFYASGYAEAA